MSKSKFDSDGFQIISSRRFSKNKQTKIPLKDIQLETEESVIDIEKAIRRINSAVDDLRASIYLEDLDKSVSTIIKHSTVVEIICLGLGHIGECNISRYQLALLLCLKDLFRPKKVFVHDPIFYMSECEVLKRLGLDIIEENKEGNYVISEEEITLVFLPHCPKQLTNNFLWSNWGAKLQNCVLICNSFASLIENQPNRILSETVPYIHKISTYVREITLKNNFKYTDIFNDTSIHCFPKENLENLSSDFWKKGAKPQYDNTEEFITSLMIEKLKV